MIERIKECLKMESNHIRCSMYWLLKAWQDPKYDIDIMLFMVYCVWAIGVMLKIYSPNMAFISATAEMTLEKGNPHLWAFSSMLIGISLYFSIFLRKPILRLPVFFVSLIWGMWVTWSIYDVVGPNMASLMYLVLLVYFPIRKIQWIIRSSFRYFHQENSLVNMESKVVNMHQGDHL